VIGIERTSQMHNARRALGLVLLLSAPLCAHAVPIIYQIKFTVLSGSLETHTFADDITEPTIVHSDATGRVYLGLFSVDSNVLLTDGIGKPGDVGFFFIRMEDTAWGYNLSLPFNAFEGFRGPTSSSSCQGANANCFGALSPGFDVVNGVLAGLRGGVFGQQDHPFVDFNNFYVEPGRFSAAAGGGSTVFEPAPFTSFTFVDNVDGTLEIFRVPEPDATALFALALAALGVMRRSPAEGKSPGDRQPPHT
jgi:hypothetical protein